MQNVEGPSRDREEAIPEQPAEDGLLMYGIHYPPYNHLKYSTSK